MSGAWRVARGAAMRAWFTRHGPRATGHVFAVVICACTQLPVTPPRELRVLVYNIHAGKDADGRDNLDRVAGLVRATSADVVLLQEVDRLTTRSGRVDQVARLTSATGFHAAFGKTLDYQGGEYGIAILSRWRVKRDSLVRLPVEPPQQRAGGSYEPRGALHAVIDAPFGELHVINTHLDASAVDEYRIQEVRTLGSLAATARSSARTLVGGDLNANPDSRVLAHMYAAGWTDEWSRCGRGDATGFTYPWNRPIKRIDYLLIERRWRCREAHVLENDASDHRPSLYVLSPN